MSFRYECRDRIDFHVPGVIWALQDTQEFNKDQVMVMEEKLAVVEGANYGSWWLARTGLFLSVAILGIGMGACGPRRLNVMNTPQETLMAIGYSADRSDSIFKANNDAQMYCERRHQTVSFVKQDTIYQGQYPENVTAGARTAGRVAGALGGSQAAAASRALSSPTDYQTTFEFVCK